MTTTIRSIIVEDESRSASTLKSLLAQCCPNVEIIGLAKSVKEAVKLINDEQPGLVFLDIALPDGDGFNILEKVTYKDFDIIFTTAYDNYAIKAFEFSAVHYLLKPINQIELQKAVEKYEINRSKQERDQKLNVLEGNINGKLEKLVLPSSDGLEVVDLDDIIMFEASHNYTHCFLIENRKLFISRPLSAFESMLGDHHFVRIHSKYIVNLKYLKKYIRGSGGSVIMADSTEISVSKSRKSQFIEKLNEFTYRM